MIRDLGPGFELLLGSESLPWFLPVAGLAFLLGFILRRRIAALLRIRPVHAVVLAVSLGVIIGATFTPLHGVIDWSHTQFRGCDLSRMGFIPLHLLLSLNEASGNILMFAPLGFLLALIPSSRRRTLLIIGAIALPFVIEGTQLLVPVLDRACESADVVDNLTGLAVGVAAGLLLRRIRGDGRH